MAALLTRDQVKQLLLLDAENADTDEFDAVIDRNLPLVTSWFESYCDRGLAQRDIVAEEVFNVRSRRIYVWSFPLNSLTAVRVDGATYDGASYILNKWGGYFQAGTSRPRVELCDVMSFDYNGGYPNNAVPEDLAFAFAAAVGQRSGVPSTSSSGGSSVIKSIGLGGGALSVAFDTSVVQGGVSGSYDVSGVPTEVQAYASVLDRYVRQRA